MSTTGWIILGVIVVLVLWAISIYNGLVAMRQRVGQAGSDIDVQLKQRHDLVPNLVETVKGYAGHERGTLEAVVQARNAAMAARGPGSRDRACSRVSSATPAQVRLPRCRNSRPAASAHRRASASSPAASAA